MFLFTLGAIFLIVAILVFFIWNTVHIPRIARNIASPICLLVGIGLIVISTALEVKEGKSGLVTKKFGANLENGSIVATNGEKGPQARLLPDGWHFGYWPWLYDLKPVDNINIEQGYIGVITAMDGKPLPEGEIFAPAWENPSEMIDGVKFLNSENGYKGPQLTVLSPGQYRYNPRLFKIDIRAALEVPVGSVAVIKSNAGDKYNPEEGDEIIEVNGVPIVPNGYRGIWREALQPNAYYIHPDAYVVRLVQTTKRVYNYTSPDKSSAKSDRPAENNSVEVKTKDAFEFPVDIRVSVKINAADAPYVVAMLADPDSDPNNDGFDILEDRAILPSIRSIFRNTAEDKGGLEYVNSRSLIEHDATDKFRLDMKEFRIEVDRVYIAYIGLKDTPQGAALLKTQTDRELAKQEEETYKQQTIAQLQRAEMVRAEEAANQEKNKQAAAAKVQIAQSEAEAKAALAVGEAAAYKEKIIAFGGVDHDIQALVIEGLIEVAPNVVLPKTLVIGGQGGSLTDLLEVPVLTKIIEDQNEKAE